MKKASIYLSIIIILFSIADCRNQSQDPEKLSGQKPQISQGSQQEDSTARGQGRRRGQTTQAVGRGYAQRGFGGRNARAWTPEDVVELTEEEKQAVKIETVKVTRKPLRSQLSAMGKVFAHPKRKAIVSYAFPARVSQIHVQIGDWIKKGQQLITLQSEEVGAAKSDFYKTKADYELAKVNYERGKRLFERGVGAQKDFLASEAEFKVAQASLDAAEKKLHVLGFSEEQVKAIAETHQIYPIITLYAPIDGKVIEHNAVLGAMVDQGNEILTLLDPKVLCIHAEIYENDIAKIRLGQIVEASVPAYPGEKFSGKISYISDVLKEETRTITVRTEIENHDYKLKPGMFADIIIFLNHQSQALVLPKRAVLDEKDEKIVFQKIGEKYVPTIVETGAAEGDFIEILRGISEGDEIVTSGNFQLKSKLYEAILKKGSIH
jgi:cobalt-zinc-cadmium efflux system membrane fusion protein